MLTLDEFINKTGNPIMLLLNASHWKLPVTERPALGSTEIWTLINPTDDSHPIHLQLVRFQILPPARELRAALFPHGMPQGRGRFHLPVGSPPCLGPQVGLTKVSSLSADAISQL